MPATPRILHVGKFFPPVPGGIETYLADLLVASLDAGLEAAALVHQPYRPAAPVPSRYTQLPLFTTPSYGQLLYAPISPGFPLALHHAIRSFRPNLLHLHLPNVSAFSALALPSARRLPWVVHWHADVGGTALSKRVRAAYPLYRPLEQAVLRRSQRIIATSSSYLAASQALAAWQERCRIVPLGVCANRLPEVDPSQRTQARKAWPQPDGLCVLAAGRLTYYKGFEVLLEALARTEPTVNLILVGTGPLAPRLERIVRERRLEQRLRLAGYRTDSELQALMAACDVLCLPSIDRSEAFGIVLMEAMRYGKPVIASDIPGSGVGWVVREGGHGLLVLPRDAPALAGALERMLREPALRTQFQENARTGFAHRFEIHRSIESISELYCDVLRPSSS